MAQPEPASALSVEEKIYRVVVELRTELRDRLRLLQDSHDAHGRTLRAIQKRLDGEAVGPDPKPPARPKGRRHRKRRKPRGGLQLAAFGALLKLKDGTAPSDSAIRAAAHAGLLPEEILTDQRGEGATQACFRVREVLGRTWWRELSEEQREAFHEAAMDASAAYRQRLKAKAEE